MLMAENVKALRPLLPVLEAEYAKRGYRRYCTLFNSKYWNVPQNRERYFVVGVHESLQGDFIFPTEQHDYIPKLSSILETDIDEKYYIPDDKARIIIDQALQKLERLGYCHATLTAQGLHGVICQETGLLNPDGTSKTLRVVGGGSLSKKHNYEHVLVTNSQVLDGVVVDDTFGYDTDIRVYDDISPTLRQSRQGVKVLVPRGE